MTRNAFEVGDVVCLKSGGPNMNVDHVSEDGIVCVWFDVGCRAKERTFDPRLLTEDKEDGVIQLIICHGDHYQNHSSLSST